MAATRSKVKNITSLRAKTNLPGEKPGSHNVGKCCQSGKCRFRRGGKSKDI